MEANKEKFVFYLKIILSMLVTIAWSTWIINLPKAKNKKPSIVIEEDLQKDALSNKDKTITQKKEENIKSPNLKLTTSSKEPVKQTQKAEKETKIKPTEKVELPKLANLEMPKNAKEQNKKETNKPKKDTTATENKKTQPSKDEKTQKIPTTKPEANIKLNLPTIAGATRQALLKNKSESPPTKNDISLREKIPIDKDGFKTQARDLIQATNESKEDTDFNETWLPKYITEKKEMKAKTESIINSLDLIASQLELEGIINNPGEINAAIIRNKKNNSIEILKIGEEYKGLKLLEVNKNEIKLVNESLNKTYIKKTISNAEKNKN